MTRIRIIIAVAAALALGLGLGANILAGEIAGAQGGIETQIAKLTEAVAMQDDLPYIEPPSWFYPVRQSLGAALLAASREAADDMTFREDRLAVLSQRRSQAYAEQAEAVYREDLRQYPHNGWSLFGLAESLRAQGKQSEATEVRRRFETAWQNADVSLIASRF